MTDSDRRAVVARALQPASWRVRKVGQWWFVVDLENPSGFVPSVSFSRRKDATSFADRNAAALFKRYREEGHV